MQRKVNDSNENKGASRAVDEKRTVKAELKRERDRQSEREREREREQMEGGKRETRQNVAAMKY